MTLIGLYFGDVLVYAKRVYYPEILPSFYLWHKDMVAPAPIAEMAETSNFPGSVFARWKTSLDEVVYKGVEIACPAKMTNTARDRPRRILDV